MQAGQIESDRVRRGVFDARGNRPTEIEQSRVGGFLLPPGALAYFDAAELLGLRVSPCPT